MISENYNVLIDGIIVAEGMSLEHALIFIKALFAEYYNDTDLSVSIEREKIDEKVNDYISYGNSDFDFNSDSNELRKRIEKIGCN